METEEKNPTEKRYTLIPQITPLPSQDKEENLKKTRTKINAQSTPTSGLIRAINEDDDGYDPYSDYKEKPQMFEKDPWH